jgi:DNA-binding PadR family transcriptional regulator
LVSWLINPSVDQVFIATVAIFLFFYSFTILGFAAVGGDKSVEDLIMDLLVDRECITLYDIFREYKRLKLKRSTVIKALSRLKERGKISRLWTYAWVKPKRRIYCINA